MYYVRDGVGKRTMSRCGWPCRTPGVRWCACARRGRLWGWSVAQRCGTVWLLVPADDHRGAARGLEAAQAGSGPTPAGLVGGSFQICRIAWLELINFSGIFRSPSLNVYVWDLLPIDLDQLDEWYRRLGIPCVSLILRCKYTYKCRDQMRKVKMWQIWTRKNYCSWQRKL